MRIFTLVLMLSWSVAAPASEPQSYCKRIPFDQEVPAGIFGEYDIIGKEAGTGATYAGTLRIQRGASSYLLTRKTKGRTLKGEAWFNECGPDKFQILMVALGPKSPKTEFACYLRGDGDNFIRASCTTAEGGGLESWYQKN